MGSNKIWKLQINYSSIYTNGQQLYRDDIFFNDKEINKAARRDPVGGGYCLMSSERDLEYEFQTFPAASTAAYRISKIKWVSNIRLESCRRTKSSGLLHRGEEVIEVDYDGWIDPI